MPADNLFWISIYLLHIIIIAYLVISDQFRNIPKFSILIAQDILQTPILWSIYHYDHRQYLLAYTIGKTLDIVCSFLAIGELLCSEYELIGRTLEYYMMAEMAIVYVLSKGYPHFWHRIEWWMKPVYVAFELIWMVVLWNGGWHVRETRETGSV